MWLDWLLPSDVSQLGIVALKAAGIYLVVIIYTRIAGLRSFSKMSSFDFVMTVAVGTCVASAALAPEPPLIQAMVTIATLYVLQILVAHFRTHDSFEKIVDNQPQLLFYEGEFLDENLQSVDLTMMDLRSKLREANVVRLDDVHAVVFETTGDVSVIHSEDGEQLDEWLLKDVSGHPEANIEWERPEDAIPGL